MCAMTRGVAALVLVALAAPVQGAVDVDVPWPVAPSTMAPPTTLSSLNAKTVVGPSQTSATTSGSIGLPLLGAADLLAVVHGPVAQDVAIRVTGRAGFAATDSVSVVLGASAVLVASTTALPAATPSVDLGTVSDLRVTAAGACLGTCTLSMEIRTDPDGAGATPTIVYPYTLSVT
jgi:hypothetical protein